MASEDTGKPVKQAASNREDRLKAALKANMAKRKAQARARYSQDDTGNGPADKDNNKG